MSVKYRLYQDNRKDSTTKNMWFAKAVHVGTADTKKLAKMIQDNVSVKRADVISVLDELVNVMTLYLQEGYRVKLDGFGTFKIGLKTTASEQAKDFTAAKNVVGSRVNFQPETRWSAADGRRRRKVFIEGLQVEELPKNAVGTEGSNNGGEQEPTP